MDDDFRALRRSVYDQERLVRDHGSRIRALQRFLGGVLVAVGLALAVGGLWVGLHSTSFGDLDCGKPLASTNRSFGGQPPSDNLDANDIPVDDCLVWLSANRATTVALLIPATLLTVLGAVVALYRYET